MEQTQGAFAMLSLINEHRPEIERLCVRHHVARLELFGSAATGDFEAAKSDLDFLVHFVPLSPPQKADAYFGLLHGLQDLFHRQIDLVSAEAMRNPFFQQSIQPQRTVLYAA
jgi:predicted nucleotidyltransferase